MSTPSALTHPNSSFSSGAMLVGAAPGAEGNTLHGGLDTLTRTERLARRLVRGRDGIHIARRQAAQWGMDMLRRRASGAQNPCCLAIIVVLQRSRRRLRWVRH